MLLAAAAACEGGPLAPESATTSPEFAVEPAGQQDFSGYIVVTDVLDEGDRRVTNGGVTQYRDAVFEVTMYGDVSGVFVHTQVSNWNQEGNGTLSATWDGEATWNGLTGRLTGRAAFPVSNFEFNAHFTLKGEGDLAGHKFRVYMVGPLGCLPPNICPYTGTVVTPVS